MRSIFKIVLGVLFIASLFALRTEAVLLDGYAAAVGERVITVGEVKEEMQRENRGVFLAIERGEDVPREKLIQLYKDALDRLIQRTLILAEFDVLKADDKAELPDEAVNKRIDGIILDRYHNDRALFFEDLKQSGMTFAEFTEQTRNDLVMLVMRNQSLTGNISVSPVAVKALYLENLDDYEIPARCELGMIVLQRDGEDDEKVIEDARRTLAELRNGVDFAALASERSDGSKAKEGGYRGWLEINDLRKELREAVKEMSTNDISGIIKAGKILYILKLYNKQDVMFTPFEEIHEELERELMKEEYKRLMDAWEKRLRTKHHITRYPVPTQF